MLDAYGLHELVWDACDERFSDMLVASPADAGGRGISLAVRDGGAAADMTGATLYLAWRHKATGARGTEPFQAVSASAGTFKVFYPAAMCEAAGAVQAQIVVSRGDDTYISSRVFTVKVEPVVIGGEESEDGFTLFIGAINAYENATEITTDAATAANAAAALANTAAGNADQAVADLLAAAQAGDFDGQDGADGFSPTATVTQTATGATITITDKNGTTTADIAKGAQGEKGETGEQGPKGEKGDTGETGPQGPQGESGPVGPQGIKGEKGDTGATGPQGPQGETGATGATGPQGPQGEQGPKGETGDTGATGPQGPKGDIGDTGPQGPQGEKGETGATGATGPQGETGPAGQDGADGVSCTHSWSGTVLSVTSASGTSSADLVGPQGPTGPTGATGPAGADGTIFTPASPLSLENGELSIDLSGYAQAGDLPQKLWSGFDMPWYEQSNGSTWVDLVPGNADYRVGDLVMNSRKRSVAVITALSGTSYKRALLGHCADFGRARGFATTTDFDVAPGVTADCQIAAGERYSLPQGCLILNTTSGNLMRVNAEALPTLGFGAIPVNVTGLANIYSGGTSLSASSPLSIANDVLSIDLSAYAALTGATFTGAVSGIAPTANAHFATKKYVDDAIAALDDLSEVNF